MQPERRGWVNGSSDPSYGSKEFWKYVKLTFELQPGSPSLFTNALLVTELANIGVTTSCYSPIKLSVFAQPGTAANQNIPNVSLTIFDPVNGGTLGERLDYGSLNQPANLHYRWPDSVSGASFGITTTRSIATAEVANSPAGTAVWTVRYLSV